MRILNSLNKLFGIEPSLPPPPPDSDDDETTEAVMAARNADVRSVIDKTLDDWKRDKETIKRPNRNHANPSHSLREARLRVFQ